MFLRKLLPKKSKKTRSLSIRTKLLIPSLMVIIILSALLSFYTYKNTEKNLTENTVNISESLAGIASKTISSKYFNQIRTEDDMSKPAYKQLSEELNKINSLSSVKYIYTLYIKDKDIYYGVDPDEDEETKCLPGDLFEYADESNKVEYDSIKNGKIYSDTSIIAYGSANEEPLLTSLAPVYDSNNKIVGAIGCDYDAQPLLDALKDTATKLTIITLLCIAVSSAMIILIINRVVKNMSIVNKKIHDLSSNEGDLTQTISITTGDELENIANNTNNLLEYIRNIVINILNNAKELEDTVSDTYTNITVANENVNTTSNTIMDLTKTLSDASNSSSSIAAASEEILSTISTIGNNITEGVKHATSIKEHAETASSDAMKT